MAGSDKPSVVQIKRSSKEELLELAGEYDICLEAGICVRQIKEVLINALWVDDGQESVDEEPVVDTGGSSGDGSGASLSERLQLRRLELEFQERREAREHEYRLKELELRQTHGPVLSDKVKINDCYRSLPNFDEVEVEGFFKQFERIASELKWPNEYWHILVQSKFKGKATVAYNSLSDEQSRDYQQIKSAILRAYEVTSEAYRQQFRSLTKLGSETYAEFIAKKGNLFDKWMRSESVKELTELRDLMVLEEVRNNMSPGLRLLLSDQKVHKLAHVAEVADNYSLVHKVPAAPKVPHQGSFGIRSKGIPGVTGGLNGKDGNGRIGPGQANPDQSGSQGNVGGQRNGSSGQNSTQGVNSAWARPKCSYCHMTNHTVDSCFKRNRDNASAIGFVKSAMPLSRVSKYIHKGSVSDVKVRDQPSDVSVYRDTGAWQTLMLSSALPKTVHSATGDYVIVSWIGQKAMSVPLHRVWLNSDFVSGEVVVGVVEELPFEGVDVLLCNDLTDRCCQPRCFPELHVHSSPVGHSLSEVDSSMARYPACVTTRSMSKVKPLDEDVDLADTCVSNALEELPSSGPAKSTSEVVSATETETVTAPKKITEVDKNTLDGLDVNWSQEALCIAQKSDETLQQIWSKVLSDTRDTEEFYVHKGILMRRCPQKELDVGSREQIVVPKAFRTEILSLAHESLFAGHLGRTKTYDRLSSDFFWPGMYKDVEDYCSSCHVCQVAGKPNQLIPPAPLKVVPAVGEAFSKVLIDIVGPLPKTSQGNQYLLTIMCLNTRFPEAIPLRKVTAAVVTKALIKYFTMTGLPNEIQSDQGSNFMSNLFRQVMLLLEIHQVRSSAYHPESQGALERFHQTLKSMLRCFCLEHERDWDVGLPYVLFAARDSRQESLGFSPFELVYGHTPRGPLKLVKDKWLDDNQSENLLGYVARIKDRLWQATTLAKQHLLSAQNQAKARFDRKAQDRQFEAGDKVLLYLPIPKSPLKVKYFGPYTVKRRVNDLGYVINTPDRHRKERYCHINLLKAYRERTAVSPVGVVISSEQQEVCAEAKLRNSEILADLNSKLAHLSPSQRSDMQSLIEDHLPVFPDAPG
ncbi:uncharacterized protein [Haliotis asinina]|uniref:uncharacterized protein n=1 Tax=Haliotis asinina TaxID=109174 RepID=UPI003532445D